MLISIVLHMDDLRSTMLNMRQSQNENDWIQNSESISKSLMKLPEISNSKVIGFYSPIQGEADTKLMIVELLKMGKTLCLPKINTTNKIINFFQIIDIMNLVRGTYDILEPNTNIEILPANLQCVVVPGIAFDDSGNRLGYGYGYYKANVLSFFNPGARLGSNFSWSNFLPTIPIAGGEYEGFGYLGLGGIILLILLFFFFVRREPLLNFKKNRPYYLLVIIFFIIAISNIINFGNFVLLNISLPNFLYAPLSILRASGRFIWPIYYLIFIAGLVVIYKKIKIKKNAILILILILFIQIIDISSGLKNYVNSKIFLENKKFTLNDPIWNLISKDFQNIRITYLKNSPNVFPQMADILLKENFKKTDIFALGRINRKKASIYRNKTYKHFRNNKLDKNTIFIVNDKNHLRNLKLLFKESNNGFFFRNNFWILIPNQKKNMSKSDWYEFDKIDFINIFPGKEKKLYLHDEESVIGLGWTHNLNSPGVWTEGNEANIIFKFKNYEQRDYILIFKIKSVMTNNADRLNMLIRMNGEIVEELFFDRFTNQDNKFINIILKKEDLKREFHKVDFIINNPVSPVSLLESADGRELGILFESIKINYLN